MNEIKSDILIINNEKCSKVAKFLNGYKINDPIGSLVLGISIDNKKETEDGLLSFVHMVNSIGKNKINRVKILVGAYLYRHYGSEKEAENLYSDWVEKNTSILKLLDMDFDIINWKDIFDAEFFKADLLAIKKLYETDLAFAKKINGIAENHKTKAQGDFQSCKEYLLEECAYFLTAREEFTYPAPKLNEACMHVLNKRAEIKDKSFNFRPYEVYLRAEKQQKQKKVSPRAEKNSKRKKEHLLDCDSEKKNKLLLTLTKASLLMSEIGLHHSPEKESFFKKFLEKTEHLKEELFSFQGESSEHTETKTKQSTKNSN